MPIKVPNIIRTLTILLLCTTLAHISYSQTSYPGLDLISDDEDNIEIPFRYIGNFMLVDIKLLGVLPMVFIFDTGAEHTILLEKQVTDLMGIKYDKAVKLRGSDISKDVLAYISRNITFEVNNTLNVKRDIVILDENFMNLQEMIGTKIDGIMGGSFFRNLIIEIDHKRNKLIFWHPDRFNKRLNGYSKSSIEIINSKPYLACKTQKANSEEIELKLLIDSGASITSLINTSDKNVMIAPEQAVPGNIGTGLGGNISGFKGKLNSLSIDAYTFDNILTHFQEIDEEIDPDSYNNRDGLIGNLLLERFNIIIDYTSGTLYMKPLRNLKKEFKYNLSGMELISFGADLNNYIVFEVVQGSPAAEAGIEVGDILAKIGLFSASKFTLSGIDAKLSRKPGKTIKFKLLRGDALIDKEITLKDFLAR